MKLLPYENFYITTKLTPGEVVERLKEVTSPDTGYTISFSGTNPSGPNTPFKGYIYDNGFKFKPNIIYRNSFLPQIIGSIESDAGRTRVHVKMTIYLFLMIVTGILLAIAGIFCIKYFPHLISNKHTATDIVPFFIFLFLYILATGAFKSESITSKSFLKELLEDERL